MYSLKVCGIRVLFDEVVGVECPRRLFLFLLILLWLGLRVLKVVLNFPVLFLLVYLLKVSILDDFFQGSLFLDIILLFLGRILATISNEISMLSRIIFNYLLYKLTFFIYLFGGSINECRLIQRRRKFII